MTPAHCGHTTKCCYYKCCKGYPKKCHESKGDHSQDYSCLEFIGEKKGKEKPE